MIFDTIAALVRNYKEITVTGDVYCSYPLRMEGKGAQR